MPRSPPWECVQSVPVQSLTLISHSPHATSSSSLGDTCRLLTSLCFVPSSLCAPRESLLLGELLMPRPGPSCGIRSRPKTDGGSPQARFFSPPPPLPRQSPDFHLFREGSWGWGSTASLGRNSSSALSQTELVYLRSLGVAEGLLDPK